MGKDAVKAGIEFVHGDLYGVAIDVLRKFVSSSDTRPMLQYSKHYENGDIIATDSHRLIHIKEIHGFKEDYLVNPKNFMFAKGHYPKVEHLTSREKHTESMVLTKDQIKIWLQIFKSLNQISKVMKYRYGSAMFVFHDDHVTVELETQNVSMKLPIEVYQKPDVGKITFRLEYMRDALEAHFKLNSEQLTFFFHGDMRPIVMDDDKAVKTLLLPIRTF